MKHITLDWIHSNTSMFRVHDRIVMMHAVIWKRAAVSFINAEKQHNKHCYDSQTILESWK